jgi:hypothetical protein
VLKTERSGVFGLSALVAVALFVPAQAVGRQIDVAGPPGSVGFGESVTALPNGNFVVIDAYADSAPLAAVGAVYLYGPTGELISALKGGSSFDQVGDGGVVVLANGNFVVISTQWRNTTYGSSSAGAVTWVSGASGLSGTVTASNSLVGTHPWDQVGSGGVTLLANGSYVIVSPSWNSPPASLVGAVTWANGQTGIAGEVSSSNSLTGSKPGDQVGRNGVVALSNGNYVVASPHWNSDSAAAVGAATWGNGSSGISGVVSTANSLAGSQDSDSVAFRVTALINGNYVVSSPYWKNGGADAAGAVTWANGATGASGPVSAGNSLVGSHGGDHVGEQPLIALANGNYLVPSPGWSNGTLPQLGAVTWAAGNAGTIGPVSQANSLVGASANDQVGFAGTIALANGNYVVGSPYWDDGATVDVGAATWGDGAIGVTGLVSVQNSLTGSSAADRVGGSNTALSNGHYVVASGYWDNGPVADVGAAVWCNGVGGRTGVVSAQNALTGSSANDGIYNVVPLDNGDYVVSSVFWDNGSIVDAGAATRGDGIAGTSGLIGFQNSIVGTRANDTIGSGGISALDNGSFMVSSPAWDDAATPNVGAMTWSGAGATGVQAVSRSNSLVGVTADDFIGSPGAQVFERAVVTFRSAGWDNGALQNAGAVTIVRGDRPMHGEVGPSNSVVGGIANGGGGEWSVSHNAHLETVYVGRPAELMVTIAAVPLFASGFD